MSWRTNRSVLLARDMGRRLGVNKLLSRFILGRKYEESYDKAFSACIQTGDCIWDIGANVGLYTKMFATRVGSSGRVIAFEPSVRNFARLVDACHGLSNVSFLPYGMGASDSMMTFQQGADDIGATSRFVEGGNEGTQIPVRAAMSVLGDGSAPCPDLLKIDVEGFELDVLNGFGDELSSPQLRAVGVEVHFGILRERGQADAPAQIEKLLKQHGFNLRWVDPSHFIAVRK